MFDHIVELQMWLQEQRGETNPASKKIRMRTAALDDAYNPLKSGWNPQITAEVLNLPISVIEREKARLDRYNEEQRKFLTTGHLEPEGGYFAIYKK